MQNERDSTLIRSYRSLALESPARGRDAVLRALDVSLAAFFLLVLAPVSALIALALLATNGRPLLYRGERVGRGGRISEDTTPVARGLGATQLDEIPQLWNVLRGDMSLVGPRPIRPIFFEQLAQELPAYWQRLVVRPGLTGFAQVRRGYETSMAEKLAHDLEWIADRSVRLYLRTLATTAWRVLKQFVRGLTGRGA